jgi:hypothetical protein
VLNILWVPVVAFLDIAVPDRILTVPIVASFLVSILHGVTLYRLRVRIGRRQLFASMIAAMSVQLTVARAVGTGLVKDRLPFIRTDKGGCKRKTEFPAFWEAVIATLLLAGSVTLIETNYNVVREINIFAAILVIQSVPFLAAVVLALLERSPLNDLAVWRAIEARTLALLPRRATLAKVTSVASDKREAVQ